MKSEHSKYKDSLDFLYSFVDYERSSNWKYNSGFFDLNRVRDFLHIMGDPHRKGPYIHVAGTNGKGSVSAMIASVLTRSGYRTGLYTSPHLMTFRERISIDALPISQDEVIEEANRIRILAEQIDGLTFFEVWTVLAFDYFARQNVDVSVIEVGIGGRLDATNVIEPAVSVITSISMDHQGKLGETLVKIANEKAGIIKSGVPVIYAPQTDEVSNVIETKAHEMGSTLIGVGRDVTFSSDKGNLSYWGLQLNLEGIRLPLQGEFQCENASVALAAAESLMQTGFAVTHETARRGIENVSWPGRIQTVSVDPEVIVDGACNTGAMKAVCNFISDKHSKNNVVAVVGMCEDKDIPGVLDILRQSVSRFVFTQADNRRALSAWKLADFFPDRTVACVENNTVKALQKAVSLAGADGMVIVTGSLYLVGEVMNYYGFEQE